MSRRLCSWCSRPIRKWIALNDSSDNYCSWICNKMEEQAYTFIYESQVKYQATYQRIDRDIWSLPIMENVDRQRI